eukprot:scaffold1982_cov93-Amphora_coffeaeformis.AAC.56
MKQLTPSSQKTQANAVVVQQPVKPKRPLSAYNYFFQFERARLLDALPVRAEGKPRRSHGKLGFRDMAKIIGGRWKAASEETRAYYAQFAEQDKERYKREKKIYDLHRKTYQNDTLEQSTSSQMPLQTTSSSLPVNLEPLSPLSTGLWDPEMSQMLGSFCFGAESN